MRCPVVHWSFDLADTPYDICYCPYEQKCRYSFPHLYLLVCEKRTTRKEKGMEVYKPSQFHLLTLEVGTGQIVQDSRVFDEPMEQVRFEDIDDAGVLISDSDRRLLYFDRIRS